eukprot:360589-Chlamydomonas_euryale.AAC.2
MGGVEGGVSVVKRSVLFLSVCPSACAAHQRCCCYWPCLTGWCQRVVGLAWLPATSVNWHGELGGRRAPALAVARMGLPAEVVHAMYYMVVACCCMAPAWHHRPACPRQPGSSSRVGL